MKKLIFAFTCLSLAIPCRARIITVDDDGFAEFNNIQAAINDSNDGDTVIVADGTYTGVGNRDIDFKGKAITVRSQNGPQNCIINCQSSGRGFYFHSGETAQSVLSGFTVINGLAPQGGGAILCKNSSSPTIEKNLLKGNSSLEGGAIACTSSSPVIQSNTIEGNVAFMEGEIPGFGGGMNFFFSSAVVADNLITNNWVTGRGGGLFSDQSQLFLRNNIITGNSANGYSQIFSSPGMGGGISCERSTIMVTNNTISGNRANGIPYPPYPGQGGQGGAIECGNSHLFLANTILWYNNPHEIHYDSTTIEVNYSDIACGWAGTGNIVADPCFAEPGHWNYDFWVNGDYHLKSKAGRWEPNSKIWIQDDVTSPCIDAGNPGCPIGDEPAPNGNRRNMGAYGGTAEASKSPANWRSIADLTNDWVVDSNDLRVYVDYWLESGECIPGDFDRNQFVDFSDFSVFGLQWSYPSALEPGITYQIEKCDPSSYRSLSTEQASETRFSVLVEGSYIHFKDMMVANCCTDKLGLEMTVEDDLITIYEIEYIPGVCFCICDYPVTATLGPFEPGTYILEVYEDWGGFIGSTTVVIDPPQQPYAGLIQE